MVDMITDERFDQDVLKSATPVLVDFYADWCAPCRALAPTLAKVADKFTGKVKVYKLNIEESPQATEQYGVMHIPTLILFKGGELQKKMEGLQSESGLISALNEVLRG
jgi:thioredoxin 1